MARALGLEYYKLKELTGAQLALPENSVLPPGFVEHQWSNWSGGAFPASSSGRGKCRVEFWDPAVRGVS